MSGAQRTDGTQRLVLFFRELDAVIAKQSTSSDSRSVKRRMLLVTLGMTLTLGATSGCQSVATRSADAELAAAPMGLPAVPAAVENVPPVDARLVDVEVAEASVVPVVYQSRESESLGELMDLELDSPVNEEGIEQVPTSSDYSVETASTGLTLEAIESIALANNPAIAELVATTQKAAGFRNQVGLRANPTLGYSAAQLADEGTDQHTVFISQTIITGDKLALNRSVLNEALRAQLMQLEARKYRVATDIEIAFYEALAAQQRIELIRDFQSVVDKGIELAEQLKEAQEGSQLEVVQAKVQKNEIDLALRQAEIAYEAAWRELAALASSPTMTPVPLQGILPEAEAGLDWQSVASTMVASSPEIQAAQARIRQARANLCRQEVQPIPNVDVSLASGYDNGTNSGLINLQIGAPIPVFNRNQGNISAARAEYTRASRELQRIENSIEARLAKVSREYDSSLAAVDQYASDILPNAQEGLELAELAYKAGETSFVQVLVARRTYFDTNLQYIVSQQQLAQARARVDGFVLTGGLDDVIDGSGDDSLRGLTFSQQ